MTIVGLGSSSIRPLDIRLKRRRQRHRHAVERLLQHHPPHCQRKIAAAVNHRQASDARAELEDWLRQQICCRKRRPEAVAGQDTVKPWRSALKGDYGEVDDYAAPLGKCGRTFRGLTVVATFSRR